jgi:hypothetical protein
MTLQREPLNEIKTYASAHNVNHESLAGSVNEYITQLRAQAVSKEEVVLPEELRMTILGFSGEIKYIKVRKDNPGYFVVTHDEENGYNVVMIDETQDGYSFLPINDFAEQEDAIDYVLVLEKSMQSAHPKHRQLSELKMYHVYGDGFYVGRERYDGIFTRWMPYTKINSNPIRTKQEAESFLLQVLHFRTEIISISTGNLKVMAKSLHEAISDDHWNEFRRNVVIDVLRSNRQLKDHQLAELTIGRG